MRNNGQLLGKLGLGITVFTIAIIAIGGYAVMRHQVGNHEQRIQTVESLQDKSMANLEGIKIMQKVQGKQIEEIASDVKQLLRNGRTR